MSHSDDAFAPVTFLTIKKAHVVAKDGGRARFTKDFQKRLVYSALNILHPREEFPEDGMVEDLQGSHICEQDLVATGTKAFKPKPPHVYNCEDIVAISGTLLSNPADISIEEEVRLTMSQIEELLHDAGLDWDHVILMHVYVSDMWLFGKINSAYSSFFKINPPPRVTVQVNLPGQHRVQIDSLANRTPKETLHVQSISYWAAANIGPYAQACRMNDQVFMAGQIGLVPQSMTLQPTLSNQTRSSLSNLKSVNEVMGSEPVGCIGYVTDALHISKAKTAWDYTCPCLIVVVPHLPKSALVEWQAFNGKNISDVAMDRSSEGNTSRRASHVSRI